MPELRKFGNGKWYSCRPNRDGVYYVHYSENRRSRRKSTGTKVLDEAQAFLDEYVILDGAEQVDGVITVRDCFELKYGQCSERSAAAWKHLEPVYGDLRPIDVTDRHDAGYIAKRQKDGAAASTIRFELSVLRAAWNNAVRRKILTKADIPALDPLPDPSPPRDRWLRQTEIDKLLAAAASDSRRVHLFTAIALDAAARRTAIMELTWEQVDFETGVIHFLPDGAKQTRKRRASVPMSRRLRPVLEQAYETRDPRDPYVIGRGGRVNEAVSRVAAKAGLRDVTPHVLRHTAATHMARRGVALWLIAKVLGNTVEQVEKVYAKHSPEMLQDAVNAISGT